MAKYGKAMLVLAVVPVLAMAQSAQVRPAPQPAPAAPAASGAASKPPYRPAPSPDSRRFVTNENFFHASPQPQAGAAAPANRPMGANPAARPAAAAAPRSVPVMQQPVIPAAVRPASPAVASVPEVYAQKPLAQPVVITSASPSGVHDSSAAVEYVSGQLTVVAEKAPLSSVLKLIAARTGAVVDLAPELQNELVVARLGPDSVRDVLSRLLDSPRIDYIVFGTGDEAGSLQRIVVRTRRSFGQVAMAAIRRPQPRQEDPDGDVKLDPNGRLMPGSAASDSQMAQQERMAEWQKVREQMRQAEIQQQAEEREREKTQPPDPPAPQNNPEPENQPQDNPPQR